MISLNSKAEQQAERATRLASFPINLGKVKNAVSEILGHFGRDLLFREYTIHDIKHVNDMLTMLEWLIPTQTQDILWPGEWLMIVLSIYFHDIGLIVTENEFEHRDKSGFHKFCSTVLFANSEGADYQDKVNRLPELRRERFLYQEFVRYNHGRRVRQWIEGRPNLELGYAAAQMREIDQLLKDLDVNFRKDLALVCESHNLDDIEDVKKYRVSHPYGNSDEETVNLQYCAIALRTVDLLQITNKRAPSILYRLINPSDPVSQDEWAKQNAVKRVRAKTTVDRDGNASSDLPKDTIEVFATFTNENGFFGLTSYLGYARRQIAHSYQAMQQSIKYTPRAYKFPWRYIDDDNIQVEGFVKQTFGFEIDQHKILDLLTGHTLYNDSDVVVRELVQNAIDAVRLQAAIDGRRSEDVGRINVHWDTRAKRLTVADNGTGMTQSIIEKHLLKVGSSRYQDPKFKEAFPSFSAISRFGIGVLSSFMVADTVEIVTVSTEDEIGRQISLRSVHGKYLIKLLDKHSDQVVGNIGPHGTIFTLTFRPSAKGINIVETLRKWIKFPRCNVTASIDGGDSVQIGYRSPKDAIETYLMDHKASNNLAGGKTKVEERTIDGFTLAFALKYDPHFRDYTFMGYDQDRRIRAEGPEPPIATCVEGIAVEFNTPGFEGRTFLAVANAVGAAAPRTNVARSSIEVTSEQLAVASKTYRILLDSAVGEVQRLVQEERYSQTWAIQQFPYIIMPFRVGREGGLLYESVYHSILEALPIFLVEKGEQRSAKSLMELSKLESLWTVESELTRAAEQFIRETRGEVTVEKILVVTGANARPLPEGTIVTNVDTSDIFRAKFEISHIGGLVTERRLDFKWSRNKGSWLSLIASRYGASTQETQQIRYYLRELFEQRWINRRERDVMVPNDSVTCEGLSDYFGVEAYGNLYFLPDTAVSKYLHEKTADDPGIERQSEIWVSLEALCSDDSFDFSLNVNRFFRTLEDFGLSQKFIKLRQELLAVAEQMTTRSKVFNPLSWNRLTARVTLPMR